MKPGRTFAYESSSDILSALGIPLIFSICLVTTAVSLTILPVHGKRKVLNTIVGITAVAVAVYIFILLTEQYVSAISSTIDNS